MKDSNLETLIIRKLAWEAFEMLFAGKTRDAARVFAGVAAVKPDNRASALGFALIDFPEKASSGVIGASVASPPDVDPFMDCMLALAWLQEGRLVDATVLLEAVSTLEDEPAARLAQDILTHETGGE